YAETLRLAGVDYRNAEASFAFTRDGIEIDRMNLAYHRPLSPALGPEVTAPIGRVSATGRVGFDDDPTLDLSVEAAGVPLSALAATVSADLPLRGQISRGSRLTVKGSLRRPQVEGQLVLSGLGAAGVPLGGGTLQFASEDVPYRVADLEQGTAATAAHRLLRVTGELEGGKNRIAGEGDLDWGIDAIVAFGGGRDSSIEAAVDLRFDTLPLDNLLTHPSREQWRTHVIGGLHGLMVETRYCPSHEGEQMPMLEQCAALDPDDPRQLAGEPLRVDLRLEQLWYRGEREGAGLASGGDPCLERDTTCSVDPLVASLDGDILSLKAPWRIQSGGKQGSQMTLDGTFDLSGETSSDGGDPDQGDADQGRSCIPGVPDNASLPPGSTAATIEGALDFAALSPLLSPWGIASPQGEVDLGLAVTGVVGRPTITGFVRLPENSPLVLDYDDGADPQARRRRPIPISVD
ncbi:MAG: hypothetical protein KC457_32115, partial [Myxococcales bacterium]|nr:hypothetical protein [Myxococcales bacterium]